MKCVLRSAAERDPIELAYVERDRQKGNVVVLKHNTTQRKRYKGVVYRLPPAFICVLLSLGAAVLPAAGCEEEPSVSDDGTQETHMTSCLPCSKPSSPPPPSSCPCPPSTRLHGQQHGPLRAEL